MTEEQKRKIMGMRQSGLGYTAIAKQLMLSRDTVRSFCKRNGLAGKMSAAAGGRQKKQPETGFCRECGKKLYQVQGRKKRVFCSKECREKWWHRNPDKIKQRAVYSFICTGCGSAFTVYGNAGRKYCSHECYIRTRFKDGGRDE